MSLSSWVGGFLYTELSFDCWMSLASTPSSNHFCSSALDTIKRGTTAASLVEGSRATIVKFAIIGRQSPGCVSEVEPVLHDEIWMRIVMEERPTHVTQPLMRRSRSDLSLLIRSIRAIRPTSLTTSSLRRLIVSILSTNSNLTA
eukprot:33631_3